MDLDSQSEALRKAKDLGTLQAGKLKARREEMLGQHNEHVIKKLLEVSSSNGGVLSSLALSPKCACAYPLTTLTLEAFLSSSDIGDGFAISGP